jgi:pyruvate dehydrogenase E2 component (dihydrolipoamide acetyltransferase)
MATDIVMPNLGFDVQHARLIEWLKQPGDPIQKGEVIAVVESDKANVELESIAAGTVLELLVQPGVEVPVGAAIARVGQAQGLRTATPTPAPAQAASASPSQPSAIEISPVASKLATEHGLDLSTVTGSGPRGRITREDVEAAVARQKSAAPATIASGNGIRALPKVRKAAREAGINLAEVTATGPKGVTTLADLHAYLQRQSAPAAEPATPAVATPAPAPRPAPLEGAHAQPLSRIRQIIGRRMVESKREAPHFYVSGEFDLERAIGRLKSLPEPRPGINDLIQFLTVQTLRRVPALNAIFQDDTIYQFDAVNLAVAVAREEGLMTPVLHGAERFSLSGLAQESRKLIERARTNKLQPDDLQGGTFTISNLGVIRQVDQFVAILNPPQVAILAVGTVKQRPIVIDGGLHIRHTVHLTLSGDHRAVDGMHLGQFLAAFQVELDNFSQEK